MAAITHILTIIFITVMIVLFLGQIISDTKELYRGFKEGSNEQNGDHTLHIEK